MILWADLWPWNSWRQKIDPNMKMFPANVKGERLVRAKEGEAFRWWATAEEFGEEKERAGR